MLTVASPEPVSTVQTPAQVERELLTAAANDYNASANSGVEWDDLRWWAVLDANKQPRAVAIVTRGRQARQVLTVSKTNTPELWDSWQPVLLAWQAERAANKRADHDKLTKGKIK